MIWIVFVAAFLGALLGSLGVSPKELLVEVPLYLWDRLRGRA